MRNRRLVILISILAFIVLVIALSSTVFSFNEVSLNFLSTTNLLDNQEEVILASAEFDYGESIFFIDKDEYINRIEQANPYIKVASLEIVFPNKIVVHAVERNEMFAFKLNNNSYAICDEELKVLEIKQEFVNTNENAILVSNQNLVIDANNALLGNFLNIPLSYSNIIKNVGLYTQEWDYNLANIRGNIASVELDYERDNQLLINMRQGVQIVIKDAHLNLSNKLQIALSVYDSDPLYRAVGIIRTTEEEDGDIIATYYDGQGDA